MAQKVGCAVLVTKRSRDHESIKHRREQSSRSKGTRRFKQRKKGGRNDQSSTGKITLGKNTTGKNHWESKQHCQNIKLVFLRRFCRWLCCSFGTTVLCLFVFLFRHKLNAGCWHVGWVARGAIALLSYCSWHSRRRARRQTEGGNLKMSADILKKHRFRAAVRYIRLLLVLLTAVAAVPVLGLRPCSHVQLVVIGAYLFLGKEWGCSGLACR